MTIDASCSGLAQLPELEAERMRGNEEGTGRRVWRKNQDALERRIKEDALIEVRMGEVRWIVSATVCLFILGPHVDTQLAE